MRKTACTTVSGLLLVSLCASAWALQQANRIGRIEDVIRQWSPDQHLYVKGDLGVDDVRYAQLEKWLDENGPHWTIALLQSADGEQYRAPDGRVYQGMDAVEYALGHGLANRTGFGQLENAQTGETDGAVFVLFLKERKFSYYGSEAQDRRGLGESSWIGNLDQPAYRAMRGGGRILDAVKDTVSTINRRLKRSIDSEAAAEAQAIRQRERTMRELRVELQRARESVQAAASGAEEFKTSHPGAEGALAIPPLDDWENRLSQIEQELTDENVREGARQTGITMAEIDRYLNWYAQSQSLPDQRERLIVEAEDMRAQLDGVAAAEVASAVEHLEAAASAHANGDSGFAEQMSMAERALQQGRQAVVQEQDRRQRQAARRRLVRRTALVTVAITTLALLAFLYWLNRRRASVRAEAIKAYSEREKHVRTEMDRVLQLFERTREILGTKAKIAVRGYQGDTKVLSDEAFQKVDDLLIMSNEVDRVMDEAEDLIRPRDVVGRIQNQFSATRFERGMNRISGEPLKFDADQGIPAILRQDETDELGRPIESVSLTFDEVFSAFRRRGDEVNSALDVIESSLMDVNDQLQQLTQRLAEATEVDHQLALQAEDDGFFRVPNGFDVMLPSIEADHEQADQIAGSDPVHAIRHEIPRGLRKVDESVAIGTTLMRARTDIFPKFDQHAPSLRAKGYETAWIHDALERLGDCANKLLGEAAERSVASEAEQLDIDVTALGVRVENCAELAQVLEDTAKSAMDTFKASVDSAREHIAHRLDLPVEQCLREERADPDARLAAAREQLTAARAALQHGEYDAAKSASESMRTEVETGQQIVDASREILDNFHGSLDEARKRHDAIRGELPRHEQVVAEAQREYAASALRLQSSDPAYPEADSTLVSRLEDVETYLQQAWQRLDEAEASYGQGRLLAADGQVQVGQSHLDCTEQYLDESRKHVRRLEDKTNENSAALTEAHRRAEHLEGELHDQRTMRPTLDAANRLRELLQQVEQVVRQSAEARDPFQNADRLHELGEHMTRIQGLIASDREAHAEASRAVSGAVKQLDTALRYVEQARQDGIPDSDVTVRCVSEIRSREPSVSRVQARLDTPHDDWQSVDEDAARLNADLGAQAARLKGELERAQRSVDALQRASRDVFQAARWTGAYGIRVKGAPGTHDLDRARQALNRGDYEIMIQLSRAAAMAAQFAVEQAQREVTRRRRDESRRAEAARRAEMARRHRSRPSISFGSSSSRGSSISFGGGSSRGGSGSGFSRSGW